MIEFSESAVADLEAILDWYVEQAAEEVGRRLVTDVFDRVQALEDHPDIGRIVPEFDQHWLRELIFPPFRIVYKRGPEQIRIVRVWRAERMLELPDN